MMRQDSTISRSASSRGRSCSQRWLRLCAPIVKRTLAGIVGVQAVQITEANAMAPAVATVTFDDTATNIPALIAATTKAGYPSTPKS